MTEGRLSVEAAWNDYGILLNRVESEVLEATSNAKSPGVEKSILEDMNIRTKGYFSKRFHGDDQFRAYLHTRKKVIGEKLILKDGVASSGFDTYKDEMVIAKGGNEVAYVVGTEGSDGTPIAIKLLKADSHEGTRRAFKQEQQVLSRLSMKYGENYPPNLIKLYASAEGITITERVPGAKNLYKQIIEKENGGKPKEQLKKRMGYFRDIVNGLEDLYAAGYKYHGDLKLENCMLGDDGVVRVGDFSLVDEMAGKPLPRYGSTSGTPQYMSAERCISFTINGKPAPIDKRADVFALGIMLHQMLTLGHDPFDRLLLPEKDRKPFAWSVTAFAGFIRDHDLAFVDDQKRGYTPERLTELAEKFGHKRIDYHGCPFIADKELLKKIDSLISKALNPVPVNRFESPNQMLDALKELVEI